MTYKTGTVGEFMRWTKSVVADPAAASAAPKRWFDSKETAEKVLGTQTSPEAVVKLLSEDNIALLHLIGSAKPASMVELAKLAHRAVSNLSRTLKKLHEAGIVDFESGPSGTRVPRVTSRRVTLELDLTGPSSVVSVERPEAEDNRKPRASAVRRTTTGE
jgi:predicted transcriptional regulator